MKDDLEGARPGYIRAVDLDADAQNQPFVGPPCKRPRLAVDAPQVSCLGAALIDATWDDRKGWALLTVCGGAQSVMHTLLHMCRSRSSSYHNK